MAPTNTVALRVDDALATALAAEAERTGTTISDLVRAPLRAAYVRDRPQLRPRGAVLARPRQLASSSAATRATPTPRGSGSRTSAANSPPAAPSSPSAPPPPPPPSHPRTCRWSPTAPSTGHCGTPAPQARCPPPARSPCPARSP